MTCAYSEMYLKDAMRTLGETVDFALFDQVLNPAELMAILSNSREMKQFERGMPRAICGMSGDELAREIYQKQLAAQSGVTLRVIQLYEQNQLDLRRASVSSALALAKKLDCSIEDLIWQPVALEFDSRFRSSARQQRRQTCM